MKRIIVVSGATGDLGFRIVKYLLAKGAEMRAIVRAQSNAEKITQLEQAGVILYKVKNWTLEELTPACLGANCVVSAVAGLRDVVIDAQKILLDAAVAAKVPRFIPSDYSLDFTRFSDGENRNFDLRRAFHAYLDKQPIAATSIFNATFADMLLDEIPMIIFKRKLVLYWGNADHSMDFTTRDNTAEYTACTAIDDSTPRYLHIAGDQISARQIKDTVSEINGKKFRLLRTGGQGLLGFIIKITKKFAPSENELYPAWQGMQYMHNMIDKRSIINKLDNDRYREIKWTTVKEVLQKD